jgi:Mechanosensitive ion channel
MLAVANLVAATTPTPTQTTTTPPAAVRSQPGNVQPRHRWGDLPVDLRGHRLANCRRRDVVADREAPEDRSDHRARLDRGPAGKRAIRALVVTLPKRLTHPGQVEDADERLREQQRNDSIERLLVRLLRFTVWFVAIVMILDVLGINVTPVIVSAGILGLALSLGAQTMVKDLLGGISIIVDRQLAVGDFVDLADPTGHVGTSGVVEAVGLSSTTLRNGDGEIWDVPNSDIRWIGNLSERWARIVIDVRVGYGTALRAAKDTFSAALGGSLTTGATATPLLSGPSNRSCGNSRTTLSSCERRFASTENVFERSRRPRSSGSRSRSRRPGSAPGDPGRSFDRGRGVQLPEFGPRAFQT